jgi:RNA polymerase sigma-54 factor
MTLLSLTSNELQEQIEAELASNPALEMLDEIRCPTCRRLLKGGGICPVCSHPALTKEDDPIVFVSTREVVSGFGEVGGEDDREESSSAVVEDLATYVFRQIAPDVPPEDRKMAAHLLTNLDEDGLCSVPLAEVAMYFHVPLARVENLQRLIQRADPIGVGSLTPKEALLVQLDVLRETREVPEYASQVVEGMELLSRRQFHESPGSCYING